MNPEVERTWSVPEPDDKGMIWYGKAVDCGYIPDWLGVLLQEPAVAHPEPPETVVRFMRADGSVDVRTARFRPASLGYGVRGLDGLHAHILAVMGYATTQEMPSQDEEGSSDN